MAEMAVIRPDRSFIEAVNRQSGGTLSNCFQCATCSSVCDLSPEDKPYPRKEMLWGQLGMSDRIASDPDIWLCHQCNDCSDRCPRGAKPGEVLAAMRNWVIDRFASPNFMGRALSTPAMLPLLLLLPVLVIGGLAMWAQSVAEAPVAFSWRGPVEFGAFIPHGYIEMLFIAGNVLIFALASVGLYRFYTRLQGQWGVGSAGGFISGAVQTALEIGVHGRFDRCRKSHYRRAAHLLIMFGFIGAMATAGLALLAMMVFDFHPPIPMSHPIKWLGNASGAAMLVGLVIVIVQRSSNSQSVGAAGYSHWLFVWTLVVVAGTGMTIQFLRIAELPLMAYSLYFVHLVAVFFLLWYAPFSQFGHMFYRTLAMVYARSINRLPREVNPAVSVSHKAA